MDETKSFYSSLNVDGSVNIPKKLRKILKLNEGDSIELQIIKVWKRRESKKEVITNNEV